MCVHETGNGAGHSHLFIAVPCVYGALQLCQRFFALIGCLLHHQLTTSNPNMRCESATAREQSGEGVERDHCCAGAEWKRARVERE